MQFLSILISIRNIRVRHSKILSLRPLSIFQVYWYKIVMINSTNNEVSYNCSSDLSSFHIQDSFKSIIIIYRQMTFFNSDTLTTPPQDSAFLYHEWTRIMISNVCNKELSRKLEVNKKFSFFVNFNSTNHFIDSTFFATWHHAYHLQKNKLQKWKASFWL